MKNAFDSTKDKCYKKKQVYASEMSQLRHFSQNSESVDLVVKL